MDKYYKKMLRRASCAILGFCIFYGVSNYYQVPKFVYREKAKNGILMSKEKKDSLDKEDNFLERILKSFDDSKRSE